MEKQWIFYGVDYAHGRDKTVELEIKKELKELENTLPEKILAGLSLIQLGYALGEQFV